MSARTAEIPGVLRPSNAIHWGPCAGSFFMESQFPEDAESEKAREGTAAHYYATEGVLGREHALGTVTPNGVAITQEMIDGGQHFISDILGELLKLDGSYLFRVETKVYPHGIIHPDNEGTPDAFLVSQQAKLAIVWDYKFGHRAVDVFRNRQLINYLAGVLEGLELTKADCEGWRISLRIVQPRNYGAAEVTTWEITGAEAWAWFDTLSAEAYAAKTPGAHCVTGDHCRDCTAAHACDALRLAGGDAREYAGTATPQVLDARGYGEELRAIARAIKRLEARKIGVEEVIASKIRGGENVPHWMLGRGDKRQVWTVPPAEVFSMGDLMGHNLRAPQMPITPVQATKLGIDEAVILAYSEKPAGAVKLLPVDVNTAAKAFS